MRAGQRTARPPISACKRTSGHCPFLGLVSGKAKNATSSTLIDRRISATSLAYIRAIRPPGLKNCPRPIRLLNTLPLNGARISQRLRFNPALTRFACAANNLACASASCGLRKAKSPASPCPNACQSLSACSAWAFVDQHPLRLGHAGLGGGNGIVVIARVYARQHLVGGKKPPDTKAGCKVRT